MIESLPYVFVPLVVKPLFRIVGSRLRTPAGQPVRLIKPGDTVWIPPNVKHWHGATATTAMTHIAIAEALDGKVVDWMEQVSDADYASGFAPQP